MAIDLGKKAVSAGKQAKSGKPLFSLPHLRVSNKARIFFVQRLALLLETGGALYPSLESLRSQTSDESLAAAIGEMAEDVREGKAFSEALLHHPEIFSPTYVSLIGAAERGGYLPKILYQLLEMEEKQEKMRSTIFSAISYPAFLLVFSTAVVIFILAVVFPKFADMFAAIHDQLPITTLFLMAVSEVMRKFWFLIIPGFVVFLMAVVYWYRSAAGKRLIDRAKLRLPVIRDVFVQIYLVQFLRMMSLSLSGGVPLLDILSVSRGMIENQLFDTFIDSLAAWVTEGQGLAIGFETEPFIPAITRQMIRTGEESGTLAMVMSKIADFYEQEIEKKLKTFEKIIEPLMLVVMGVVVGVIVASLILPIFKLSRAVR